MDPSSFSRFKDLPPELQDQIWAHAIAQIDARIVEIRRKHMTSTCPIPSLLHTCRSSRELALKRWKPSFAAPDHSAKIFFDYASDTLFFGQYFDDMVDFGVAPTAPSGAGVLRIAFSLEKQWGNSYDDSRTRVRKLHESFPDLREIVFLNMNQDFDFEADFRGEDQPATEKGKRVIVFYPNQGVHAMLLGRMKAAFEEEGWRCPTWTRVNYSYEYEYETEKAM